MDDRYISKPSDLTFRTEATITLTPQKVAELYWQMCEHDQAKFWNHLGLIAHHELCLQTAYLATSKELQPGGIEAIQTISAHFNAR